MKIKDNFATIISVYAPTMTSPDENKEAFYNQLASVLSGIRSTDKLLLIGDFNARIGRDNDKWPLVMGKHGVGKCNSNDELLLALCSEFVLIVTNTMFKQKDERKTTWMHPRSKQLAQTPPEKFTTMIEAQHTGMMANVSVGREVSESFNVTNGVKQGCILAPTLFSVFLSAMLDKAFRDMGMASTYSPDRALTYSTSHTSEQRPRLLGY